jgi:hypothetical protein
VRQSLTGRPNLLDPGSNPSSPTNEPGGRAPHAKLPATEVGNHTAWRPNPPASYEVASGRPQDSRHGARERPLGAQ